MKKLIKKIEYLKINKINILNQEVFFNQNLLITSIVYSDKNNKEYCCDEIGFIVCCKTENLNKELSKYIEEQLKHYLVFKNNDTFYIKNTFDKYFSVDKVLKNYDNIKYL